jgi:hypothetical protein
MTQVYGCLDCVTKMLRFAAKVKLEAAALAQKVYETHVNAF